MFRKKSTADLVRDSAPAKQKKTREERPAGSAKHFFTSKIFLGILCIIAALVLAFVVTPLIQNQISKTIPVVMAAQNLPVGTRLTPELLTVKEVGQLNLPEGTVLQVEEATGYYLSAPALAGDILTRARLTAEFPTDDPILTALPEGKMAVSATLSTLSQSVSGKLRAGDVIQVFAVLSNANTAENIDYHALAVPELQRVEILSVTNASAVDIEDGETTVTTESDRQLATVTLAVNTVQASALAGLDHTATLHAALVVRGDAEAKAAALGQQETYFSDLADEPVPGEETGDVPGEEPGEEPGGATP